MGRVCVCVCGGGYIEAAESELYMSSHSVI